MAAMRGIHSLRFNQDQGISRFIGRNPSYPSNNFIIKELFAIIPYRMFYVLHGVWIENLQC